MLEPLISAQAALHARPQHIRLLRESNERLARPEGEVDFTEESMRFHDVVAWASGNAVYGYLLTALHWLTEKSAIGIQEPTPRRQHVQEVHVKIAEAVAAHDATAASKMMHEHLAEYVAFIRKHHPRLLQMQVRWELFDH
jgi:DNA-binding FadR family transcriptional regulator